MNILATYATSYVAACDLALSARSEHPSARSEQMAGKREHEAANDRGFRKLFSLGARAASPKAA
ncbi:MAG: hypothetical protein CVT72_05630 [Alphaproteobacteria bacterium HGW-Alphaproteobacteria-11]|nr:MAG: hypothetical protein CVT72_05630 [Alphaproteobacteria bacterium HGW-Alphaproteobacteria-11]